MKIFIGCSSSNDANEVYKEEAKKVGEYLSDDNDLVFGASNNGLMGIIYEKFLEKNRSIIAVCYEIYLEELKKLKTNEEYIVKTLGESNEMIIEKSDVLIFMPGAYGTMCELIYAIETKRTKNHNKKIIIYNINNYFSNYFNMLKDAYDNKLTKNYYEDLCIVVNGIDELKKVL